MARRDDINAEWLQPPEEDEGLRRYVQTIRERWALILVSVLVTTAAATAYVYTAPKTYEATADVLVSPLSADQSELVPSLPLIRESFDPTRDVETASLLITNIDVAESARAALDASETPRELLDRVEAQPVAQSNIVAVTAAGDSPDEARDLANGFAQAAVDGRTTQLHEAIDALIATLGVDSLTPAASTQLRALRNAPAPDIRVETEAQSPTGQASPRVMPSIAGGIVAGLVLGIAGAFASQILDPRLRREDQLRRLYRLPILSRIPKENARGRSNPIAPRALSATAAEAYRTLRTTLTSSNSGRNSSVILVTGPSPSDGKSTTALNLASSLALSGNRVILIEADLRRPTLASALELPETRGGVVSVLIENTSLGDALVPTPTYGASLQVLPADYEGGWISELFSIPAAGQMIDDARRLADYVVIDSPPLNEVVDALPLARRSDQVLMVVRLGSTRLDKIARLAELLAENQIQPVGFTVVGAPRPKRGEYHYYVKGSGERDGGATRERSLFGS